jgi:hypothetical protein
VFSLLLTTDPSGSTRRRRRRRRRDPDGRNSLRRNRNELSPQAKLNKSHVIDCDKDRSEVDSKQPEERNSLRQQSLWRSRGDTFDSQKPNASYSLANSLEPNLKDYFILAKSRSASRPAYSSRWSRSLPRETIPLSRLSLGQ